MRTILHVLTPNATADVHEIIARQREQSEYEVQVVDLTESTPDYDRLLELIFAASSVQVW